MLKKPHPFVFNRNSVIVPTVITFVTLLLLRPFNFNQFTTAKLLLWSAIFSFLVGVSVFICMKVVIKLNRNESLENWTVGKEIVLILSVLTFICLLIFGLFVLMGLDVSAAHLFQQIIVKTLAISFLPLVILILFEQYSYQRLKRKEAEQLSEKLKTIAPKSNQGETSTIYLKAENETISLKLSQAEFLLFKSEGNYVEVYYFHENSLQKKLIRNSLKAIEEQLPKTSFFRCHNRYLINVQHIQQVEGNARNLLLSMKNWQEKIPVSRSKSAQLKQFFAQDEQQLS
ncbi:MAG: LytTR family DNA-binding domain-containing protein [Vicingaceae bacterium]